MTVKLSQQKISRLLKYYFAGMTQPAIAQKVVTDQSTISLYAKRFSERAAEIGLLAAAKEYNMKEVSELRNLSVEMQKYNLTTEDAREGVGIIKAFSKLGVPTDQHTKLIQVAKKIDNPGFINASLELVRIEEKEKISYEEAITKYQAILSQLPLKKNELTRTKTQLNSLNRFTTEKERELNNVNTQLKQMQETARVEREDLEQDYEARRQQLQVQQEEVEDVAQVKAELSEDNLDIATMIKLVNEYSHGTQQIDGIVIRKAIEKHHSIEQSKEVLKHEKALLEEGNSQLNKQNSDLMSDNAKITTANEVVDKSLVEKRLEFNTLTLAISRQGAQYELFQGFMAMLVGSPSVKGPIESLMASLQMIKRSAWYSPKTTKEWMGLFVRKVFGDYLQSFKCDRCGCRFMVSKGTNKAYISYWYQCPACYSSRDVKPDYSFLEALVPGKQLPNIYNAELLLTQNTILKPFRSLLPVPCIVCGELITNWTEDEVKRVATGLGWGHTDCLNTSLGKTKQLELVHEHFPKIEENEELEPLKAFYKVKCEICGEPIQEWTEKNINNAVKEYGWAHNQCWQSDIGIKKIADKMVQILRREPDKPQAEKEQPVNKLTWPLRDGKIIK